MGHTPPRLLDLVSIVCRHQRYSPRTEDSSKHSIRQYIYFHDKRHSDTLDAQGVEAFLNRPASVRRVSASIQTRASAAAMRVHRSSERPPMRPAKDGSWPNKAIVPQAAGRLIEDA